MLQYIGHTSPECLADPCTPLNTATPSPLGPQLEGQTISIILSQKTLEHEYVAAQTAQAYSCPIQPSKLEHFYRAKSEDNSSIAARSNNSSLTRNDAQFQYCKLLFSQLGLAGWERRKRTYLLNRTDKLLRELRNLDTQRCRETHKVAVIYVASGQEDKNSIFRLVENVLAFGLCF